MFIKLKMFCCVLLSASLFGGCVPKKESKSANGSGHSNFVDKINDEKRIGDANLSKLKISATTLDYKKFDITGLAVGSQKLFLSESPVISFFLPLDADYVEIYRCPLNARLIGNGTYNVNAEDIQLSRLSEAEKTHFFASNDMFAMASRPETKCELITDGAVGNHFHDNFAPSGSHRYLVRACVSPQRIIDVAKTTTRNCSRRVAVSAPVKDYVNHRKEKELYALRKLSFYKASILRLGGEFHFRATSAVDILETCDAMNHEKAIKEQVRRAWVTIASAALEVWAEYVTVKATVDKGETVVGYYLNFRKFGFQRVVDRLQLIQATEGYTFATAFIDLTSSRFEVPSSCSDYFAQTTEIGNVFSKITDYTAKLDWYNILASYAAAGESAADGESIDHLLDPPSEDAFPF